MSYRLDQRDEADLRYYLGDDVRGDVGVHSDAGSLDRRAIYLPIQNHRPFRYSETDEYGRTSWHGTIDVGLRCGPIDVKPKRQPFVSRDMSRTLVRVSEKDAFVDAIWEQLGPADRQTLEACYSEYRLLPAFEIFGDLAPLVCDTKGALTVEHRERTHCQTDLSRYEAMIEFAARVLRAKGDSDASESDSDLFLVIEMEADARLSSACRNYTAIADRAYAAKAKMAKERACG